MAATIVSRCARGTNSRRKGAKRSLPRATNCARGNWLSLPGSTMPRFARVPPGRRSSASAAWCPNAHRSTGRADRRDALDYARASPCRHARRLPGQQVACAYSVGPQFGAGLSYIGDGHLCSEHGILPVKLSRIRFAVGLSQILASHRDALWPRASIRNLDLNVRNREAGRICSP